MPIACCILVRQLKHDPFAVRSLTACSGCGAPGVTLLLGVWLALGPGRAVSKKFRFYPWMQQCGAVATAILVWFGCLARPPLLFVTWQPTAPSVNGYAPCDWLLQASCPSLSNSR